MIVFYDGNCPLCVGEMNKLKRFDQHNKIDLVNIHDNRFSTEFPEIEHEAA
ncbi:DCC1-like thiol-disulfide oxidoreductase family protein, partial [Pseudoalteromonas sp. S1941]